jgi:hypothetical protein
MAAELDGIKGEKLTADNHPHRDHRGYEIQLQRTGPFDVSDVIRPMICGK